MSDEEHGVGNGVGNGQFDWEVGDNLTPMGQVDSVGRFARGARRFRRPGRRGSRFPVWALVGLVVVGALVLLVVGALAG